MSINWLSLFALATPLAGAFLVWLLPARRALLVPRRCLYGACLGVVNILVLVAGAQHAELTLPFWGVLAPAGEALRFSFDALGTTMVLLLSGPLALAGIALLTRPLERLEAVGLLTLLAAGIGACTAGNLLTLCLAWGLMDLAMLIMDTRRMPEEGLPHAVRDVVLNAFSTIALMAATVLLGAAQGHTAFPELVLAGTPLKLLMAAALLRLGVYPLPGSLKRRWESYLVSLSVGGCLWLRLAGLAPIGQFRVDWLISLSVWGLFLTGVLASLATDFATALPYIILHGVAAATFAPMLLAKEGIGIAFLFLANASLCLALLRVDVQVRAVPPLGRWARLPLVIALGSLSGWPLTAGILARWSLIRLAWVTDARLLVLVEALSFLLVSVPIWRRLRVVLRETRTRGNLPLWSIYLAFGCAALVALLLVALSVDASLAGLVRLGSTAELPGIRLLFSADAQLLGLLGLTVLVFPILGGYALQRLWARPSRWLLQGFDAFSALLELDWLYAGLERALYRLGRWLHAASLAVEETFSLGWVLIWGLVILLYLVGR
jgi:hypothetical protein